MRAQEFVNEEWSEKYKRSINCSNPKGFSQKAHCAGRKKNEDLNEFAPGGDFKPPVPPKQKGNDPWGNDDRSKLLQTVKQLLLAGNKVDWKVAGQMGHVVRVNPDSVILKRWNKPYSKINYSLMLDDSDDENYLIRPVGPKHYKVVSSNPDWQLEEQQVNEFAPNGFDGFEDDDRVPMHFVVEKELYNRRSKWKKSRDADGVILFTTKQEAIQAAEKYNKLDPNREFVYGGTQMVHVDDDNDDENLNEFAPDEGGGSRKFIPWPEFIEQVKQIVGKDFSCKENIVKSTIKARFVPHDPMEFGPTMLYSYYETRAGGRNKGAVSTRGSIQVGKYTKGGLFGQNPDQLLTGFHLLKGHPFERHFDLTFDNIYKIANIILGNTEGALEFKPEGVAEEQLDELTFRGSQCTKDCSGHAAGYEWSKRKGGVDAASLSPSFNKGAALFKNGY